MPEADSSAEGINHVWARMGAAAGGPCEAPARLVGTAAWQARLSHPLQRLDRLMRRDRQ
jgi:hypothetical protein